MARRAPAPDQDQRDLAVAERRRNVLIDAGAGTGKTTILVERLVGLVAPLDDGPAIPIDRLAAITFTRKAAGELRLRIRESLLRELAAVAAGSLRERRLREALAGLDTAWVGTIHSFADRLLRLRPVEAALSPSYEVVEDESALVRETFEVLLQAVESDTLASELAGTPAADRADEATKIVVDALDAGVPPASREFEWATLHGLDDLVAGFLAQRDVLPPDVTPAPFDLVAFRAAADEFVTRARPVTAGTVGADWLIRMRAALQRLRTEEAPVVIGREIARQIAARPRQPGKKHHFGGDETAWQVWNAYDKGGKARPRPLKDDLTAPLHRWLATRLVRLFPVVVAIYEKVKARRRALDQFDLLAKLRDLLRDRPDIRGEFQRMLDHVFVDEFQDTDPLQAEIVLFLCEREPRAREWSAVELADGRLTLVGDPKQSIYRFRRADVAMYDRVREIVKRSNPLEIRLSANFRSGSPLIDWLNDRFERVLGVSPDGRPFDAATGVVFHQGLKAGRGDDTGAAVEILPFDFEAGGKHKVDEFRALEADALARYLRWLVERSGRQVEDPLTKTRRPVGWGDIAVLAISTWNLPLLFPKLDAEGIPYASRGGTLFLEDALHRQFLLGLRAIADRDDGVAEAALLRPPFFAADLLDLLLADEAEEGDAREEVVRAREARALVRELRRRRFERSPGSTARDLLELTAFGRSVALGPNGAQRLTRLRELCLVLEQTAAADGLDYDAVTARLREWVDTPVQLDPPYPVGAEAVQVLTVHQAKGLEFPVVVLWDGKAGWDSHVPTPAWRMERDGRGWTMDLDGLKCEAPAGLGLAGTERAYRDAERRRVVYVAATRARDFLVIPAAGVSAAGKIICADLMAGAKAEWTRVMERYFDTSGAAWSRELPPVPVAEPGDGAEFERQVSEAWTAAAEAAARPRFAPGSVAGEAGADAGEDETEPVRKPRESRFGPTFGTTVHKAIGLVLGEPTLPVEEAVRRAASATGLDNHLEDAVADVRRAAAALDREGLTRAPGADVRLEYPIAGAWDGGRLLSGYVDLVAVMDDRLDVVDFKSDMPPTDAVQGVYPEYAAQVTAYCRLLSAAGVPGSRRVRGGLLFTADGEIRWL